MSKKLASVIEALKDLGAELGDDIDLGSYTVSELKKIGEKVISEGKEDLEAVKEVIKAIKG